MKITGKYNCLQASHQLYASIQSNAAHKKKINFPVADEKLGMNVLAKQKEFQLPLQI